MNELWARGYGHPDLESAAWRYTLGLDNCQDREILREYGGTAYWHLDGCACDSPFAAHSRSTEEK